MGRVRNGEDDDDDHGLICLAEELLLSRRGVAAGFDMVK